MFCLFIFFNLNLYCCSEWFNLQITFPINLADNIETLPTAQVSIFKMMTELVLKEEENLQKYTIRRLEPINNWHFSQNSQKPLINIKTFFFQSLLSVH